MKKVELLAPSGSPDALMAAVQSGADAVYVGAERFSARSSAENFPISSLDRWIDYAHLRGVKVHLAANTLIKDRERQDFIHYVSEAYRMGIDAVIIQDLGMAERIKQLMPELELHASTQMTVTTAEGVNLLAKRGFSRAVLSRELTKSEIYNIRQNTSLELEAFVHGAICFSYSGQCLMSSIIGQRSGNRGMCAQPCRLPYQLTKGDGKEADGYLLSPKDLCLLDNISELADMGIASFKIEGRLKSAGYTATAVGVYRKALDGEEILPSDRDALLEAFNRSGFTEGWYGGGKDMMSGKTPSNVAGGRTSPCYEKYTAANANFRKIGVDIFAELKTGEPMTLVMIDGQNTVTAKSDTLVQRAEKVPLDKERIALQLSKLGETVFFAKSCEVVTDGEGIIPISEINALRRKACTELELLRTEVERVPAEKYTPNTSLRTVCKPYISAVCRSIEQADMASEMGVDKIVAKQDILDRLSTSCERVTLEANIGAGRKANTDSVMIMNLAQSLVHTDKKLYGGFRLNVTNSETADSCRLDTVTLSPELNLKDIAEISAKTPVEVIAYGRLPLMLMRKCPAKAVGCAKNGGYKLIDRRGEKFPIVCDRNCTSELLNSKPIYMADKLSDIENAGVCGIQLWFFDETGEDVKRIITEYKGEKEPELPDEFTRGHFYRGFK